MAEQEKKIYKDGNYEFTRLTQLSLVILDRERIRRSGEKAQKAGVCWNGEECMPGSRAALQVPPLGEIGGWGCDAMGPRRAGLEAVLSFEPHTGAGSGGAIEI